MMWPAMPQSLPPMPPPVFFPTRPVHPGPQPTPAWIPYPSADTFQRLTPQLPTLPFSNPFVAPLAPVQDVSAPTPWNNQLKSLFHQNKAIIYALNLRTFGADDQNADGRISARHGENGTFLSAIKRLDELKALGVNTIHLLPINPIGAHKRFGEGGSLYAPSDYHSINPEFDTPGNGLDVVQEARIFINECHKRGIHVMVDVPSCASYDLMNKRPDLILKGPDGKPLTPTNWVDIVMFKNSPALRDYYEGFFDLMVNQVGVDGFRVDVARARPTEFWKHFIGKYPDKGWLAETYTQEDASPLKNLPRDIPEELLRAGFDTIYGQFHIFHSMANADEYIKYLLESRAMFARASQNGGYDKSFIGSFVTHDDMSLMEHGGVLQHLLVSGLMATQPWTNPYILDGFSTAYNHGIKAHNYFDIFNYRPRPVGKNPEVGRFLDHMFTLRQAHEPVFNKGLFIPIPVQSAGPDNQIIAFARHANGKTFLVLANKDINARSSGTLTIPGLSAAQPLVNLAPEYGRASRIIPGNGQMHVDLGPGRFHIFEINTPTLPQQLKAYD